MAKREAVALFEEFEKLFGVLDTGSQGTTAGDALLEPAMQLLMELREDARKRKDFKTSDLIRDRLKAMGVAIEDSSEGPKWKRT
jgi:cysteinyl-tRNA synthetase